MNKRTINNKYKTNRKTLIIYNVIILIFAIFLSLGFSVNYSLLNMNEISSTVRIDAEVRINAINILTTTSEALSNWEEYNVSEISSNISLPNIDSTITFTTEVIVLGSKEYGILNIVGLPENLEYSLSNYELTNKICDDASPTKCNLGATKKIDITIKYKAGMYNPENINYNLNLEYIFKTFLNIKYNNLGSINPSSLPSYIISNANYQYTFKDAIPDTVNVKEGTSPLILGLNYTYNNGTLTIPNVKDDLTIDIVWKRNIKDQILLDNQVSGDCPNASSIDYHYYEIIGDESRPMFCEAIDDNGSTYYYRGGTLNNYLYFANQMWRIVRIDGNGSIRITTESPVTKSKIYSQTGTNVSNTLVGYMNIGSNTANNYVQTHTNTTDSLIKTSLDNWYIANLSSYESFLYNDISFCNDRSIFTPEITPKVGNLSLFQNSLVSYSSWGNDTGLGYGRNTTFYGAWYRLIENSEKLSKQLGTRTNGIQYATYTCYNKNDNFSKNSTPNTNSSLKYPIGTLTADDLIFSGISYSDITTNKNNALHTNTRYWTMTPAAMFSTSVSFCNYFAETGWMTCGSTGVNEYGVRPVVSIKGDLIPAGKGNGTRDNPYRIE